MISPIHIITITLGIAFLLGLLKKLNSNISTLLMVGAIGAAGIISALWYSKLAAGAAQAEVFTAGFKPPYSINLLMSKAEALITLFINVAGFLGGIYLYNIFKKQGIYTMIIFLVFIMSLNVIVMTRDIFNLFVFMEVASIAIAGLAILDKNAKASQAGFKYLIATGIISGIFLIGIAFTYYFSGTLNIDFISNANLTAFKAGGVTLFLLLIALVLELKPFPANGWAIDVYHGANPGVGAMVSAASATALLYVLHKVLFLMPGSYMNIVAIIGIVTFVGSNLMGLKQTEANRLLGYSSVGQIGLLLSILGLSDSLGEKFSFIAVSILVSHFLAKAGLFWLSGIVKQENIKGWANLRRKPFLLVIFGTFIFTLIGFPPFPSFFGKWELIMELSASNQMTWVVLILLGSFIEGIYLFRWLGYAIKLDFADLPEFKIDFNKILPVAVVALLTYIIGYHSSTFVQGIEFKNFIPLFFIAAVFILDFLPAFVKNTVSIAAMAYYAFMMLPGYYEADMLRFIFASIFILGGILTLVAGFYKKGKREGFYPAALIMFTGLAGIIEAKTLIQFFFSWELMTLGSYILIIRGKKSMPHGLSYMLFSVAGAYSILTAFGMVNSITGDALSAMNLLPAGSILIFTLLAIGFMTKTASLGLHIWLPGAHAEAESDVSPMVSAILLKAGVFGLILTFLAMGGEHAGNNPLLYTLGWLGAITALIGNLAASFQEDAKRLLAYSSIGQLGYILFAFAMASNLGWMGGITYTLNHFAFKAILFLTIGGIVYRLGTHNMYEMGGLIKRMPYSFIAVLIGIITLSGVPPLSGFAGKWLFYNAILAKGWYFQGAVVFFAGVIAFLYCFRLIYAIFLGQLKDNHRKVKEIPASFLIPIYILIIGIMIFSAKPNLILEPVSRMLAGNFPSDVITWSGAAATTEIGYWNGTWIMVIVGIMFVILLGWLLMLNAKAQKVEQFNIVYAAERPHTPETTHMAHNLYAGYNKALGILVLPYITNFWNWMSESLHAIADFIRRIYSGNGQAYVLHIIAYILIIYFSIF